MKLKTFAILSFLACFLLAIPPMVSASDDPEVFVVALDSRGDSYYMKSIGGGQFTQPEFLGHLDGMSYGNGIGNFDSDTHLDYIMGLSGSNLIYIFRKLNEGNQFATPQEVGTWHEGMIPANVVVADFNENDGDDNLDFILVQFGSIHCELYTGDGELGFTSSVLADVAPLHSFGADAADFNNDTHADFVVAQYLGFGSPAYLYVNLGNGDGTFETLEVQTYDYATYYGVAAGNFDDDEFPDLVATGRERTSQGYIGFIDVYIGDGDGNFYWSHRIEDSNVSISPVDNYDFNGDGNQDIVIGAYGTPSGIGVLLGDGEGRFGHAVKSIVENASSLLAIAAPPYVQNNNQEPVAIIEPTYQEIMAGEAVFVNAEGTYDQDGEIVSYTWTFEPESTPATRISSSAEDAGFIEGFSAEYVYYQAGLYTITLTVTDDMGATSSVTAQVRVKPLAAKITFKPKTLNLKSKGKWVQAIIKFPRGFDASRIDLGNVSMTEDQTEWIFAQSAKFKRKKARKLKVKFDRQDVIELIKTPSDQTTLRVQGLVPTNTKEAKAVSFEGIGTIRTIDPEKKDKPDKKDKKNKISKIRKKAKRFRNYR